MIRLQTFEALTEIKAEVDRRGKLLGSVADYELPTDGYSHDSARPHIEVDARGYHSVVVERGREQARLTSCDLDELPLHAGGGLAVGVRALSFASVTA